MNKDQFIENLKDLKWSDTEASVNLGVSRRSIYNYVNGERKIPLHIDKTIALYFVIKEMKKVTENY